MVRWNVGVPQANQFWIKALSAKPPTNPSSSLSLQAMSRTSTGTTPRQNPFVRTETSGKKSKRLSGPDSKQTKRDLALPKAKLPTYQHGRKPSKSNVLAALQKGLG